MTFDEFREALKTEFMHEAIYEDSEGREILVIRTLDAYSMMKRIKPWVSLTLEDKQEFLAQDLGGNRLDAMDWAEKRLKEKNT